MNGLVMLDVAIGLVFVYAILSLVASSLTELVGGWLNLRGKTLEDAIRGLLDGQAKDGKLTAEFFSHPLIAPMLKGTRLPSYLPSDKFARVALALLHESKSIPASLADLRASLEKPPNPQLAKAIETLAGQAEITIEDLQKRVEVWFDQTMSRASGWFQRRITWFLLLFGFLVTALVNADTLQIVGTLYTDGPIREAIVARAEAVAESPPQAAEGPRELVQANIQPIVGWSQHDRDTLVGNKASASAWALKLTGLAVTGFAVSLGAPFWFQLLGKLVALRATIKPRDDHNRRKDKTTEAPGKERQ